MLFEGVLVFVNDNPLYEVSVEENGIYVTYRKYVRHIYEEHLQEDIMLHVLVYVMITKEKYPLDYMDRVDDFHVEVQYHTERTISVDELRDRLYEMYPRLIGIGEDEFMCLLSNNEYEEMKDTSLTRDDEFILYKYTHMH